MVQIRKDYRWLKDEQEKGEVQPVTDRVFEAGLKKFQVKHKEFMDESAPDMAQVPSPRDRVSIANVA